MELKQAAGFPGRLISKYFSMQTKIFIQRINIYIASVHMPYKKHDLQKYIYSVVLNCLICNNFLN